MREDIKKIYLSDRYTYDSIMGFRFNESDENRKYYIYEWHTTTGKIFYIGKGTGNRYSHIIKEIETYRENNRKYKGQNYALLQDTYGIDYSIIMSGLTECEALIMETYYIIKYLTKKQPLLNQIIPEVDDNTYNFWYKVHYSGNMLDFYK